MSEPEIINQNSELEVWLANRLGRPQSNFIVLYADGKPLSFLGTPFDSEFQRAAYEEVVRDLNDRSRVAQWIKLLTAWRREFCKLFDLPKDVPAKDFRPVFEFKIHRTCAGYATYLHVAISLIEDLARELPWWEMRKYPDNVHEVIIISKAGNRHVKHGKSLALVICEAVRAVLEEEGKEVA